MLTTNLYYPYYSHIQNGSVLTIPLIPLDDAAAAQRYADDYEDKLAMRATVTSCATGGIVGTMYYFRCGKDFITEEQASESTAAYHLRQSQQYDAINQSARTGLGSCGGLLIAFAVTHASVILGRYLKNGRRHLVTLPESSLS
jgi:hypothetical protein